MRPITDEQLYSIEGVGDKELLNDLINYKNVLSKIKPTDKQIFASNINKMVLYLYNDGKILQNNNDIQCQQLFALIFVNHPTIARQLQLLNPQLFDMVPYIEKDINKLINKLGHYMSIKEEEPQARWLLEYGIRTVCSGLCLNGVFSSTYFYIYNDGQLLEYIDYVRNHINSNIKSPYYKFNNKTMTYNEYKNHVIKNDIDDFTKKKHNLTDLNTILLQDIESAANRLIKTGNLKEFKKIFIVMPRNDSIGCWRLNITLIAKKYYIYKTGIEILIGSSLYDKFITANFKLILWLFHLSYNKQNFFNMELPNDIIYEIIKLLSCKIGPNRLKPIISSSWCLTKI